MSKSTIYTFKVCKSGINTFYSNIEELSDSAVVSQIVDLFGKRLDFLVRTDDDSQITFLSYHEDHIKIFLEGMKFMRNIDKIFEEVNEGNNSGK